MSILENFAPSAKAEYIVVLDLGNWQEMQTAASMYKLYTYNDALIQFYG